MVERRIASFFAIAALLLLSALSYSAPANKASPGKSYFQSYVAPQLAINAVEFYEILHLSADKKHLTIKLDALEPAINLEKLSTGWVVIKEKKSAVIKRRHYADERIHAPPRKN